MTLCYLDIFRRSSTWSPSGSHQPSLRTVSSRRTTSIGRRDCRMIGRRNIRLPGHAGTVLVSRGSSQNFRPCRMINHCQAGLHATDKQTIINLNPIHTADCRVESRRSSDALRGVYLNSRLVHDDCRHDTTRLRCRQICSDSSRLSPTVAD